MQLIVNYISDPICEKGHIATRIQLTSFVSKLLGYFSTVSAMLRQSCYQISKLHVGETQAELHSCSLKAEHWMRV